MISQATENGKNLVDFVGATSEIEGLGNVASFFVSLFSICIDTNENTIALQHFLAVYIGSFIFADPSVNKRGACY